MRYKDYKGLKTITNKEFKARYRKILGRVCGEGSFGVVNEYIHRLSGVKCAIKVIIKDRINSEPLYKELMKSELEILEEVSHPYIMQIYELLEDKQNYYIVSEYIKHGDLFGFVADEGKTFHNGTLSEK